MLVGAYTSSGSAASACARSRAAPSGSSTAAPRALDRNPLLGEVRPGSLTANFHVVATVDS